MDTKPEIQLETFPVGASNAAFVPEKTDNEWTAVSNQPTEMPPAYNQPQPVMTQPGLGGVGMVPQPFQQIPVMQPVVVGNAVVLDSTSLSALEQSDSIRLNYPYYSKPSTFWGCDGGQVLFEIFNSNVPGVKLYELAKECRCIDCLCDSKIWCVYMCFALALADNNNNNHVHVGETARDAAAAMVVGSACASITVPHNRRSFKYNFLNSNGAVLMEVEKPVACLWPWQNALCCFGMSCCEACQDKVVVRQGGLPLTTVVQNQWKQSVPYFRVLDGNNVQRLMVGAPNDFRCSGVPNDPSAPGCCLNWCTGCCRTKMPGEFLKHKIYETEEDGTIRRDPQTKSLKEAGQIVVEVRLSEPNCCGSVRELRSFRIDFNPGLSLAMKSGIISALMLGNQTQGQLSKSAIARE